MEKEDFLKLMSSAKTNKIVSAAEVFKFINEENNVPSKENEIKVGTLISFIVKDKRNEQMILYGYVDSIMTEPELHGNGEKKILMITMFNEDKKNANFRIAATIGIDGNVYKLSDGQQIHKIGPTVKYLLDYLNSEEKRRREETRRRKKIKRMTVGEFEELMTKIEKIEEMLKKS